jgi:hypothetical protein
VDAKQKDAKNRLAKDAKILVAKKKNKKVPKAE